MGSAVTAAGFARLDFFLFFLRSQIVRSTEYPYAVMQVHVVVVHTYSVVRTSYNLQRGNFYN